MHEATKLAGRAAKRLIVLGVLTVAAGVAAVYAVAGHEAAGVQSVTGCLAIKTGVIVNVALGGSPSAACGPSQVQVHLAGGDVTAVDTPSGSALQGGTSNGSASVDLKESYKLPQSCSGGQVAKWNGSASWICSSDNNSGGDIEGIDTPSGGGLQGGASSGTPSLGIQGSYKLPQGCSTGQIAEWGGSTWSCAVDDDTASDGHALHRTGPVAVTGWPTTLGSLTLPAGRYLIFAKAWFRNTNFDLLGGTERTVFCNLELGTAVDDSRIRLGGSGAPADEATVSWLLSRDISAAGTVELKCGGGDPNGKVTARNIRISAVRVDNLNETFLTP